MCWSISPFPHHRKRGGLPLGLLSLEKCAYCGAKMDHTPMCLWSEVSIMYALFSSTLAPRFCFEQSSLVYNIRVYKDARHFVYLILSLVRLYLRCCYFNGLFRWTFVSSPYFHYLKMTFMLQPWVKSFQHGVCMLHRCMYGECAHVQHLRT